MVAWSALLLPALLAAVAVFVVSSLIHMVIRWHNRDYRKLPNEDDVRAAIRKGAPAPGQYVIPHCNSPKEQAAPEFVKKLSEGPVGFLYVRSNGAIKLGPFLGKWFVYTIVIGLLAGYVARATLAQGAAYLDVFRVVGACAWLAYAWQAPSDSIWKGKPWIVTFRELADGLVYAAVTAGVFGWLWPR
jgi:hypothetical protein